MTAGRSEDYSTGCDYYDYYIMITTLKMLIL